MIRSSRDNTAGANHVCERGSGKEICRATEQRGTRATARVDPEGEKLCATADESADPAESRRFRRWRRMERQRDRQGAGYQPDDSLANAPATRGRGI